jgi:hypothetical protein
VVQLLGGKEEDKNSDVGRNKGQFHVPAHYRERLPPTHPPFIKVPNKNKSDLDYQVLCRKEKAPEMEGIHNATFTPPPPVNATRDLVLCDQRLL